MPLSLHFHESQYPDAVQAGLVAALGAGRVPGRFLYDSPGQAARWLAYHQAWSPSRTQEELQGLYDEAFASTWARVEGEPITCVGVGCGGGSKDARLLAASPTKNVRYVAADTSPALVMTASLRAWAERPEVEVRSVVLDLAATPDRAVYVGEEPERGPAVWSCLGILPNMDADTLLPYLRDLMAPRDLLLLSANLTPAPYDAARARIRPQYDNPEAHAWYRGAVSELGVGPDEADLEMSDRFLSPDGAVWRVECHAVARHATSVNVFGKEVPLPEGARLEVFHSDRYLPEVMPGVLAQHGLEPVNSWVTEDREEGIYLCRRDPSPPAY